MKQLFVAASTGQNVANLPPILELAQNGDYVLWVESPAAQAGKWSAGASAVLARAGLKILAPAIQVEGLNNVADVSGNCRAWWKAQGHQFEQLGKLVLVLNGGTKLTPLGLWNGFAEPRSETSGKPHHVWAVYGNDRPAELWVYAQGLSVAPQIEPYKNSGLDLPDILEASNHRLHEGNRGRRLWPDVELPPDIINERYGADPVFSGCFHEIHANWVDVDPESDDDEIPSFAIARQTMPAERLARWKRSIWQLHKAMGRWKWPAPTDTSHEHWLNCGKEDQWTALYSGVVNLASETNTLLQRAEKIAPESRLGAALERAVIRRTCRWLDEHRSQHPIQSLWCNVKTSDLRTPSQFAAELDVALVLKNGIVLHLECKAATVKLKDLQSRLLRLQMAGSSLARMAICGPLYTEFADQPWFHRLHALGQVIRNSHRLPYLPFTLIDQPPDYCVGTAGERQRHECPTFEQSLEKFLEPYVPNA